MGSIAENVLAVREKIAAAALKAGRTPEEISLIAATKMNSAERVREAVSAGVDACGENRVQELLEKYEQHAYDGAPLHFIGTLQKNKVKYLVGKASLIQSVDSAELVESISRRAESLGTIQDVLVQVNIGREASKGGVLPEAVDELLGMVGGMKGICVRGLMAIPPNVEIDHKNFVYFTRMYNLFVDMSSKKYDNVTIKVLSMGMSGDYEYAIAEGSNMVRVGSAIFGERIYR